jgi:hypothetical protein
MPWITAGLAFLLLSSVLASGAPVSAEEFSVVVLRGSTLVRVTGDEKGAIHEETLREDPNPDVPSIEPESPAPLASESPRPVVKVIVESPETTSSGGYIVVGPWRGHHGRPHSRPHYGARPGRMHGARPGRMHGARPGRMRSAGSLLRGGPPSVR